MRVIYLTLSSVLNLRPSKQQASSIQHVEYMVPRMLLGYTLTPLKEANRGAEHLRGVVKEFS